MPLAPAIAPDAIGGAGSSETPSTAAVHAWRSAAPGIVPADDLRPSAAPVCSNNSAVASLDDYARPDAAAEQHAAPMGTEAQIDDSPLLREERAIPGEPLLPVSEEVEIAVESVGHRVSAQDFQIEAVLGHGTYGKVRAVRWMTDGRRCCAR